MKTISMIALAMTCNLLLAQTKTDKAEVSWGDELSNKKDGRFATMLGHNDENIYHKVYIKRDVFIQKMNKDLVVLKTVPFNLEHDGKDLNLNRVIVRNENIMVLVTLFDKKSLKTDLFLDVYDADNLSRDGKPTHLAAITAESKRNRGSFGATLSPDSSKVLVYYNLPFEEDAKEKFGLKVYDEDMELIWEDVAELPYADQHYSIEQFRVLNDGAVMTVGTLSQDKQEARASKRAGKSSYEYHVLVYDGPNADVKDYKIELDDWFLQDLTLAIADDGNIVCAGFYSTKGTWSVHGTFFATFDKDTKEVLSKTFKKFDEDFITQYMTERQEKKAKKKADKKEEELEMYNYDLHDIVLRDDGGALLVAEQYQFYTTTVTTTDANGNTSTRTVYHYVHNDIIVVNMNADGEIDWNLKIPKRQHTTNDGGFFSGYSLTVMNNQLYFLYNDNGANLRIIEGEKIYNFNPRKDYLVMLATVDIDGDLEREALLNKDRHDMLISPMNALQADEELFLYARKKRAYQYGRVDFN